MDNERLHANFEALRHTRPDLAAALAELPPSPCCRLTSTPGGAPSLAARDDAGRELWLHSRYDPRLEAERRLAGYEPQPCPLFCGAGLGYAPLEAHRRWNDRLVRLVILEADRRIFRLALEALDWRPLLTDPRVHVFAGDALETIAEAFQHLIGDFLVYGLTVIDHAPSRRLHGPVYARYCALLRAQTQRTTAEVTFTIRDGAGMQENTLRNLPSAARAVPLPRLRGCLGGRPAVVVGAGPSLTRNLAALHHAGDRALIVAVDTALPLLLAEGVRPHLAVAIDPLERNQRHFERLEPFRDQVAAIPLLFDQELYHGILPRYPGPLIFAPLDKCETCRWTNRLLDAAPIMPKGSNVGQTAINAALALGASPLILAGFDLAFDRESGLTHARGTALAGTVDTTTAPLLWTEGIDGAPVPTNATLTHFRLLIERDIAAANAPIIDATEGGARIAGTRVQPLAEALAAHAPLPWQPGDVLARALDAARTPAPDWRSALRTVRQALTETIARAQSLHCGADACCTPDLCAHIRALHADPAARITAEQALAGAHVRLLMTLGERADKPAHDPAIVQAHRDYLAEFLAVTAYFAALLDEMLASPA